MTIERQDSYVFGLVKKVQVVEPGSQETLWRHKMRTMKGRSFGFSMIVESPDEVLIRHHASTFTEDLGRLHKEEINGRRLNALVMLPFKSYLVGHTRKYSWKAS